MSAKGRKLRRVAVLAVFLIGLAGAGYLFLRTADTAAAADAATGAATPAEPASGEGDDTTRVPVAVAEVRLGSVSSYVTATANLIAENEVTVLAEAEGRLAELFVEEGDAVEKGQLLAVLVRDDEQIAVDKAQVRATNARMVFARAQQLAGQGLIADEELERLTMEHRVAQQELAEAQWKLERTEIRAPFHGRVTVRHVTVGQHLQLNDELFVVTDFEPLIARIYLPEKDVVGLATDRPVNIRLQAEENVRFPGRIRQISPVVDVSTGTVKITIEATHPPREVRPGSFVEVDIVRETRSGVVVLPREAVVRELQQAHVFVASDDTAEKRDVSLGLGEGDIVEIVSGLSAGEQVIVAGQGALKDGAAIKVIDDPTQVASGEPSPPTHT